MRRVIASRVDGAPHETLLVVDATTGQNAVQQARLFKEAVGVTGVALTKLDGSAKGGVAIPIAYELGLPVKLIGVGETLEDLRPFDAQDFARALVYRELGARRLSRSGHARHASTLRPCSTRSQTAPGAPSATSASAERSTTKRLPRAMREIRLALLEADVNFQVVKDFVEKVRERAVGEDVAEEPDARPAGREDRPRGADRR